jgi:DNA-directed DNA polymerase III PolC
LSFLSKFVPYSFPLLGLVRLPAVSITDVDKVALGLKPTVDNKTFMRHLAWAAYIKRRDAGRFKGIDEQAVKDRLRSEFDVFEKTGTHDYFLLLWDINRWCDEQGILRGVGRGSSGGSLTMFCLGITDINPIEYGLSFARFLSEARMKPKVVDGVLYVEGKTAPDVDSDYEYERRPEVIQYIERKYQGRTCKISTRLQLTGKTALKDVLKAYLEYEDHDAKRVTDYIEVHFGNVESLTEAYERSKDLQVWVADKPVNRRAFDLARALEGLNTGKGQHPSGVFLSYELLDGTVPVELSKTKDVVTAYDMNVSATLGLKADILGLRTLDVVRETCKQAGIKPSDISVNHPSIYDYLRRSDLYGGLFQIAEGLSRQTVIRVKPRDFTDLTACMALPRPGALESIGQYCDYVKDGIVKPIHPVFEEVTRKTAGILLYQEQLTEVGVKLFGMTESAADQDIRYPVGKKLKDQMAKMEPVLTDLGRARGIPEEAVKAFWHTCEKSADYMFNLSHCVAYATLSAVTSYLKANHPREFTLALLKMSKHEPNSQSVLMSIIAEAKQMGVDILPPDLLKSAEDFVVEETGVRFGLSHIRGISDANMSKLLSFRRDFTSKFDVFAAAEEAKISISVLVGLIMCGALDSKGESRAKVTLEAQTYNLLTPREKLLVRRLASEYNDDLIVMLKELGQKTDEKGKPYIKESRLVTLRREFGPYEQMHRENSKNSELTSYIMERHYLGFSYSSTLKDIFSRKIEGLMTVSEALTQPANSMVRLVVFADDLKKSVSLKSKKPYVKYFMSDETGIIKVMIHGEDNISAVSQFHGELPGEGDIIVVNGQKGDGDMVFCGNRSGMGFIRQPNPVKMKKGELTISI